MCCARGPIDLKHLALLFYFSSNKSLPLNQFLALQPTCESTEGMGKSISDVSNNELGFMLYRRKLVTFVECNRVKY